MTSLKQSALLMSLAAVLMAVMPLALAHSHDSPDCGSKKQRGDSSWDRDQRSDWSGHDYFGDDDCFRRLPPPPPPPEPPPPNERFGPSPYWPPGPAYRGHDQAREAVRRGEALPLREVLKRVRETYPGRVLRVQFEYDERVELWVYELRMLVDDNRLLRLKVDALTGKVLLVRGVKRPHSRGH
ncbi:PepSY domain-containing protein [Alcaligenes faecalis]|uniref:PepSY domain-containing protein n=1 Tax=Alcaligenes TaxID=507 RepID=UPI00117885FD|nr:MULTISPECIES: PepSY domain-containing protein [Alcaligenes]MDT0218790.1 hypothetical protein [Alcaligenes sp. AB3]HJE63817.1 hypothetical protein [Alcaligenes faecalis]